MSKGVIALLVLTLAWFYGASTVLAQPPVPLGGELLVNAYTSNDQAKPAIASDAAGNFVVVWPSYLQDGSQSGVFARRFSSSGSPIGGEFQVNTYTTAQQESSAVGIDNDGDFVAWSSGHTAAPGDIFLQRFGVQPLLDVDGNGVFEPLADALLIVRFGFGFIGASLITGAVGDGCTRCDAPSITSFLQTFL